MISIIICSTNRELLSAVSKNIEATIGVTFELLSIENIQNPKGLCEIYNAAANRAQYELLCFMHEDLCIKTENWGAIVESIFRNQEGVGVIGVAGSSYKSFAPSGWGTGGTPEFEFYHYQQRYKFVDKAPITAYANPTGDKLNQVVVVDGMWFCTTKSVVLEFGFDEMLLKGFHCYDLDFCLKVGLSKSIFVTNEILMEHFSEGGYNRDWMEETFKLHEKWQEHLPRSVIQGNEINWFVERKVYKELIRKMIELDYKQHEIIAALIDYRRKSGMSWLLYLKLRYYSYKYRKASPNRSHN